MTTTCETITAVKAAKLFGVDRSTVSKWLQGWLRPAIVLEARGRRSARLCKATVLVAVGLRNRLPDPQRERAELDRKRRERLEIDIAEKLGELVDAQKWLWLWEQVVVSFRDGVLALPGSLAGRLVRAADQGEDAVATVLDGALRKELETLSDAEKPRARKRGKKAAA